MTDRAELISKLKTLTAQLKWDGFDRKAKTVDEAIAALEADRLTCPECFGEGKINMSDGTSSHGCPLCHGTPKPPAPTFPTGIAETAADLKSLLAAQHAEAMELLQSKLALVMRENRRLSDELKKADEAQE